MKATWLGNVLRLAGLQVAELDGWQTRGRELVSIDAVILHHTATGTNWSDASVARLLRDGRSDLPGPLAQLGLDRSGKFWLIAAGKCNHNGSGTYANQSIGIEAYNNGKGEPWPAVQLDAWQRGTAAILRHLALSSVRAVGHRESDPSRKPDPVGVDLPAFRRNVESLLHSPSYEGDLLMSAALDDDDARRCLVRQWFWLHLGRGPKSADEQSLHVYVLATKGADACLANIVDSPEAAAFRAK